MKKDCLPYLIDPETKQNLQLKVFKSRKGEIYEGVLMNGKRWYPIINGVPRILKRELIKGCEEFERKYKLVDQSSKLKKRRSPINGQARTANTFSDKWVRFQSYGFKSSHQKFLFEWYQKKLGLRNRQALINFYRKKKTILEVGPGSGFNTKFMAEHTEGKVFSVDISQAAETTYRNTVGLDNCFVVQADLMALPFHEREFDMIVADGVLHHTPNTQKALATLYKKLKHGGEFFFYVYKRMGPARQFCDQYIRKKFTELNPEKGYLACEGFTDLGRQLSKLKKRITLRKPIEALGIPAGTHDVQRLIYYYFVKCYWNDAFDYKTNNMVNYDWYHPHFAWQHDEDEARSWLKKLGVKKFTFNSANPNGISILFRKP